MVKKGQLKIQQMAFMLMAVVLFFVLVFLFYMAIQNRNLHERASELELEKGITTAQILASTPEFTCGPYCVDTDRLMVLKQRDAYVNEEFWPVAKIKVVDLVSSHNVECEVGNYPECSVYDIYDLDKNYTSVENFVSLCRKKRIDNYVFDVCSLGKIIIGVESK